MAAIHPYTRIYFFLAMTIGIFTCRMLSPMLIIAGASTLLAITSGRVISQTLFLTSFFLPLLFFTCLIWGLLLNTVPSDWNISFHDPYKFALFISTRLYSLGTTFYLSFYTSPEKIIHVARIIKLNKNITLILLGISALLPDINYRANKILTARLARGIMPDRKITTRIKQLPYILRPLVVGIFESTVERAENWERKNIHQLVDDFPIDKPQINLLDLLAIVLGTGTILLNFFYNL